VPSSFPAPPSSVFPMAIDLTAEYLEDDGENDA
jgi:hypothetical protein